MSDFDKEIAEIYKDMELKMIESMKRNLGLHLAEETEAGIDYPQWQAIKIRELRKYQRHNKKLLKSSTRDMAKNIKDHIRDEMKQGSLHEMKRFKEAKGAGYKSAVAMKDGFFKINTRKVDALINSVQSDFSRADKAVLRMMNDTYRSTIFKYGMYVTNGVYTEKQAYDAAVKDFLSRGINCIEYKDGRRVNIADYTSMAIRTVNQRAYMAGEGEARKKLGRTLVIISHHATSCKLCQPFENKVLIDDVYSGGTPDDGDYMLLSQAMAEGLFHPRCRHGLGTYYPELEDIVHYDTEENRVNEYGTEELNRAHIENMIQKYKRLTVGSIDPANIAKYQARLNEWERRKAQLGIANSENSGIILPSKNSYSFRTINNQHDIASNIVSNGKPTCNPNYSTGQCGYTQNCQRCVQAYEFRRRGYDVVAAERPIKNNKIIWGCECFTDANGNPAKFIFGQTESMVKKVLNSATDGSRYTIYVKWKGRSTGAHVFVAEKENGVVRYLDPQNGSMDASGYFKKGSAGGFGYFRMDDKQLTTDKTIINATMEGRK